jgi:hypothetical protein
MTLSSSLNASVWEIARNRLFRVIDTCTCRGRQEHHQRWSFLGQKRLEAFREKRISWARQRSSSFMV